MLKPSRARGRELASGLVLAAFAVCGAAGLPACGAATGAAPLARQAAGQGRPAARSPAAVSARPGQTAGAGRGTGHSAAPGGPRPAGPLAGKIVGIDPGHNGGNAADSSYIGRPVWNGAEMEACDTTGTQTDAGYTEARFNFRVAVLLRADLVRAGARVVMTRAGNQGVGPCVNRRAQLLNRAHADVAIDIHADGGPAWGRGFTILEPVPVGPNDTIISTSQRFGLLVRHAMLAGTPMPVSDYYGHAGIQPRNDLAGLNLATEPKILIECGNMRNATDARLLTSARFQRQLAAALTAAITAFLR